MQHVSGIEDKAKAAHGKKAAYGTDVDLESYESEAKPQSIVGSAEDLPEGSGVAQKILPELFVRRESQMPGRFNDFASIHFVQRFRLSSTSTKRDR